MGFAPQTVKCFTRSFAPKLKMALSKCNWLMHGATQNGSPPTTSSSQHSTYGSPTWSRGINRCMCIRWSCLCISLSPTASTTQISSSRDCYACGVSLRCWMRLSSGAEKAPQHSTGRCMLTLSACSRLRSLGWVCPQVSTFASYWISSSWWRHPSLTRANTWPNICWSRL